MVKRKTKKTRGGRFIDAGAAGCVFGDPPLKCIGEPGRRRSSKFVSKLTSEDEVIDNMEKFNEIKKLDPNSDYFILPTDHCSLDKGSILPSDEIVKCTSGDEYESLLFMEKGGRNLERLRLANTEYIAFFNSLISLFQGIELLHSNGYAHFDIKPTNILTIKNRDNTFKTRLIDFDLLSINNSIQPANLSLINSMYIYWPLELKYYNESLHQQQPPVFTDTFVNTMLNTWYENQKSYGKFLIPGNSYFFNNDTKYKKTSPEIANLSILNYSKYKLSNVDIFALGKTLSDIYSNLIGQYLIVNDNNREEWKSQRMAQPLTQNIVDWHNKVIDDISDPLIYLIKEMIDINPENRPTIQDVITKYNIILPRINNLFTDVNLDMFLKKNDTAKANYSYQSPSPLAPSAPPPSPIIPPSTTVLPPPPYSSVNNTSKSNKGTKRNRNTSNNKSSYYLRSTKKATRK